MNETKELKVPDHGYVNELAKLCDCSRQTVRNALRTGMKGEKSDMVRKMYRTKYLNKH
jgi:DeoR/GlpR family transcriptional regulator of sugar metabolism